MRRGLCAWLSVSAVVAFSPLKASDLRTIVFRASDRQTGNPVSELGLKDIEIVEAGIAYPAKRVQFGVSPVDIVLVLDTQWDMAETSRNLVQGARLACRELDPDDRIALVTFGSAPKTRFGLIGKGDAPAQRIDSAVRGSAWSGPVRLYDAIVAAADLIPATELRRRVVAILTNHLDTGSHATAQEILHMAKDRSIAIFAVSVATRALNVTGFPHTPFRAALTAESQLKPLADATGGEFRFVDMSGYVLRQLFERIRSRYLAAYQSQSGDVTGVQVRLSRTGAIAFPNVVIQ
jgi:hypothetical protein